MCHVSLIARKFVLRVNEFVASPQKTHGRQRAARVTKNRAQESVHGTHTHTSQRLFGTSVCVCVFFDRGTWTSGAPSRKWTACVF